MQKTVFISGATSGIGLATSHQLAQAGWQVYAAALPDSDFAALPETAIPIPLDIRDKQALQAAVRNISNLDALVNGAGIQSPAPLEELSVEDLQQHFAINVFAHLQTIQTLLPLLRQSQSPRIVNVSSLMGKVALPMMGAYSMSKHALEAMSDTLRMELSPFGIQVALIEMGAVKTPMAEKARLRLEETTATNAASGLYANLYQGMAKALKQQTEKAIAPELVAKAILHALTAKKAKPRYVVDAATMGLFMMRKFAPDEIGDKILLWSLGLR